MSQDCINFIKTKALANRLRYELVENLSKPYLSKEKKKCFLLNISICKSEFLISELTVYLQRWKKYNLHYYMIDLILTR